MKNTQSTDFCADRVDVITNFAVITNAVIKRVHCNCPIRVMRSHPNAPPANGHACEGFFLSYIS